MSTSIDLNVVARNENHVGDVSGSRRPATSTACTHQRDVGDPIHTYGTDITRIDSGACRNYD